MTIIEILNSIPDQGTDQRECFTRQFHLENSSHDPFDEFLSGVYFVQFKGRINSAREGYEPYENKAILPNSLKASDWLFVKVDKENQRIEWQDGNRTYMAFWNK